MDVKRISAVTGGLAAAGALVGGVVGAACMAAVLVLGSEGSLAGDADLVLFAGVASACFGVVLGPLAAWLLMRHVPLWLAIGGTALGTVAGIAFGVVTDSGLFLYPVLGFTLAALAMRFFVARPGRATPST